MDKTSTGDPGDNIADRYLDMLSGQRKLSDNTVENYRRDLEQLAELAGKTALISLSSADIRRFISQLHAGGLSPRSLGRKLSAWRGLFQWLVEESVIDTNPAEDIHTPKKDKPLPKALAVDDAVRLVSADSGREHVSEAGKISALCDHAMFELLYSSGLRVSELTGLDIHSVRQSGYTSTGWIDLNEKEVTVTGKGSKTRIVPVGDAAVAAIEKWLAVRDRFTRPDTNQNDTYALFLNSRGHRMSVRLVQLRIKDHARRLGLPVNVHPHILRHSFASHILQSSGDLRAVQEMLGHASIASTQVYTALDFQHLAKVYDSAHPRARAGKKGNS